MFGLQEARSMLQTLGGKLAAVREVFTNQPYTAPAQAVTR
jgi:hypothetical protein